MLANGAKLGYSATEPTGSTTAYTDLPGLKEIPDMGEDPTWVDNTCLTDDHMQYEKGIGDYGDLTYKFKYDNSKADSPYRKMRALEESGKKAYFQETLPDGTKTAFPSYVSVKRTGGSVNGVIEFNLALRLAGSPKVTDPAA